MAQTTRYDRPLVIVVSKLDPWADVLGEIDEHDAWIRQGNKIGLDRERIEQISSRVRDVLLTFAPDFVITAESLAQDVSRSGSSCLRRCWFKAWPRPANNFGLSSCECRWPTSRPG